ncbi:MAG: type II CRISPR-associated endonuclease Cas1 [Candidatus Diapherotrites archaeon]|nr:type II CRISPR-associated endonuclease Cas1 [Candidatus Diapherotrites archaeon]
MNIVVDGFGTFLAKKGQRLVIKQKGLQKEFAIYKVDSVLIECRGTSISSNLVKELKDEEVNIIFCDKDKPIAFISYLERNPLLTKELLLMQDDNKAKVSKEIIMKKIFGQMHLLRGLKKTGLIDSIDSIESKFEDVNGKINTMSGNFGEIRNNLFALEAEFAQHYWVTLSLAIPPEYCFTKREKKGARDALNSCLNYGYAVLASRVLSSCIKAGLDPTVGILHSTIPNRSSLVYDLMEPYRAMIDRAIITLFTKKIFDVAADFNLQEFVLTKSGKEKVLSRTISSFEKIVEIKGNKQATEKAILYTCYNLRDFLLKKNDYFYVVTYW